MMTRIAFLTWLACATAFLPVRAQYYVPAASALVTAPKATAFTLGADGYIVVTYSDGSTSRSVQKFGPTFAPVATSGLFSDLIGTPNKLSQFANDAGFLTSAPVQSVNGQTGNVSFTIPPAAGNVTGIVKRAGSPATDTQAVAGTDYASPAALTALSNQLTALKSIAVPYYVSPTVMALGSGTVYRYSTPQVTTLTGFTYDVDVSTGLGASLSLTLAIQVNGSQKAITPTVTAAGAQNIITIPGGITVPAGQHVDIVQSSTASANLSRGAVAGNLLFTNP